MNRAEASFVIGTVDLLKDSVNQARRWPERQHDFEFNRMAVRLPNVNYQSGGSLSGAVDDADGVTSVSVKKIERGFVTFDGTSTRVPIRLSSRSSHVQRLRREYDHLTSVNPNQNPSPDRSYLELVQQGTKVYVTPASTSALGGTTFTLYMDVVRWRPDYTADGDTDFFLAEGEMHTIYRSVYILNSFLKEDQRVALSDRMMLDAWKNFLDWDTSIIGLSVEDADME